jgi:hypothetical protein
MNEFNFVVLNEFVRGDEGNLFFGGEPFEFEFVLPDADMFDLLVKAGCFSSKGQARKNWMRTGPKIPDGFSDFTGIGKLKKRVTVLKPMPENME